MYIWCLSDCNYRVCTLSSLYWAGSIMAGYGATMLYTLLWKCCLLHSKQSSSQRACSHARTQNVFFSCCNKAHSRHRSPFWGFHITNNYTHIHTHTHTW